MLLQLVLYCFISNLNCIRTKHYSRVRIVPFQTILQYYAIICFIVHIYLSTAYVMSYHPQPLKLLVSHIYHYISSDYILSHFYNSDVEVFCNLVSVHYLCCASCFCYIDMLWATWFLLQHIWDW